MPVYKIFIKKFVFPQTYRDIFDQELGEDWRTWEPETLRAEISRIWGVQPIEEVFEKIMALQTFLTTDLFWDEVLPFENIVLAFNDMHVDPDLLQQALPQEIAFAVLMVGRISEKKSFVNDIAEYIRECHRREGVLVYHPALDFAQPEYEDAFRMNIAKTVRNKLSDNEAPRRDIDEENPAEVQHLKTWGCYEYVREMFERGARA